MSIMPLKGLLLNCLAITFIYLDNNEIIMYTTVFQLSLPFQTRMIYSDITIRQI